MKKLSFEKLDSFMEMTERDMSFVTGGVLQKWTAYTTNYQTQGSSAPPYADYTDDSSTDHTLDY